MNAKVIVTGTGSVIGEGIVKCLKYANLKNQNPVTYDIIATDMSPLSAGIYRGTRGELIPAAESPVYVDELIRLATENSASAIFVGSDEELTILAGNVERIARESGALVITNSPEILSIGTDKWKTYQFLKSSNISCPMSALPSDEEEFIKEQGFPLVVKPREGHGSAQFYIARCIEDLRYAISAIRREKMRPLLQEYLDAPDSEFTSGVALDRSGRQVLSSITMKRILKHGQTYKAFVEDFPEVKESVERVATKLEALGPVNVQSRYINGESKVFDINPRFSASCPIRAVAGVNEPDIFFRSRILGETVTVERPKRLVCLRYWNELYVPFASYDRLSTSGSITDSEAFVPNCF